ncbi:hypothetical protein RA086_07815 [Lactiplantibacillus sp. WILCCON 0030]|uniref:DUF308 domain-containing protein n=1 Tax=Lactiplantibacillus brownii TaxID=3069269 RepID=A0ABU1AB33_9LACO|nr:hypothetical protein [Lactiplantibacillus brownii]MDQ7937535.1 hypothetical protein [Lactiplantibacillus brownii]
MLFVAIIGLLVFLLAFFSVLSARQDGGGWKFLAAVATLSALVTVFAIIKLPYWPYNQTHTAKTATATSSSSSKSKTAKIGSSQVVFNEADQTKAAATTKLKEDSILKQLKTNYESLGTVSLDRQTKTFTITPTSKKYVKSLKTVKQYPSKNEKAIATITENYSSLSKSVQKHLTKGYTVRLLEPGTTDTTLLSVKDGEVVTNNFK